jgi:hypothetical protein
VRRVREDRDLRAARDLLDSRKRRYQSSPNPHPERRPAAALPAHPGDARVRQPEIDVEVATVEERPVDVHDLHGPSRPVEAEKWFRKGSPKRRLRSRFTLHLFLTGRLLTGQLTNMQALGVSSAMCFLLDLIVEPYCRATSPASTSPSSVASVPAAGRMHWVRAALPKS